jgi:hypothetical protein
VGSRDGTLRIFDDADLEEVGVAELAGPVVAVHGLADGDWLVAVGTELLVVAADGGATVRVVEVPGSGEARSKPDCLAASADGQIVACRAAPDRVLAFDRDSGRRWPASSTPSERSRGWRSAPRAGSAWPWTAVTRTG